jgi:hypothetical protein
MPDFAQPVDYSGAQAAFANVPSPAQSFLTGVQGGLDMQKAQQLQLQEQTKLIRTQQMQQAAAQVAQNPTPEGITKLSIAFPEMSKAFKDSYDQLAPQEQQAKLQQMTGVYMALQNNRPDVAAKLLRDRATALKNSDANPTEISAAEAMAQWAELHPETLKTSAGVMLASVLPPDKFPDGLKSVVDTQLTQDTAPSKVAEAAANANKAQSDASKAASEATIEGEKAKVAPQTVLLDLQKKGWDIKAVQADIDYKRESSRIAAMNAATSREDNALKRQELALKIQEAQGKLDDKVREKVATAETGAANIDNMLNTIERIKKNPALDSVIGSIQGRMPALFSDEASDATALIDTLGSQAFLAQIPNIKGMGSLSNAEGEKLQAALQNLSRTQSETQFRANLDEAARLLNKGRVNLSRATGVPLAKPDTPAAPGARPPLSSFQGK